ncbi:polysaccharide lyase family 7 protein [Burkholderia reimsis]|nr:polysaccharide lyase family 7 protein [Burkholderia reimsis]
MDSSFVGERFYFKAGDYDRTAVSGRAPTTPGTVMKFHALTLTHN